MSKKIQDMTREELQQMLDSYSASVEGISESKIDNAEHCRSIAKDGGKASPWTKDIKNQSFAGKKRSQQGGKEQLLSVSTFESRSNGGKKTGNNNLESGHWKKCQEEALKIITQEVKCPHCPKKGNMNIMQRWHFDECKWKGFDFDVVFRMKDNGLSSNKIAQELGITRFNVNDILNNKW